MPIGPAARSRSVAPMTVVTLPDDSWIRDVGPVPGIEYVAWDLRTSPDRAEEVAVVVPPYTGPSSSSAPCRRCRASTWSSC